MEAFLHPSLDHLHDPSGLLGIAEATERLMRAREAGERVAVVGDYDVDGVSGTALLTAVLSACGLAVHPIIPHRMNDGYGFQPGHAEAAAEAGCSLVVTVDCGTTSIAAATTAIEAGLDVVVTDHHLPGPALPEGVVQINPHQADCVYPFDELSGAGLALKLAQAFAKASGREFPVPQLLRIACLGTIADLVPLRDENRVIAAIGLEALEGTRSPGLRALIETAGLRRPYTTADVGYRLGPRLNAPGRLDSANQALELLLSRDPARARALAQELDTWNRERQGEERRVVEEAREHFATREPLPPILVAWGRSWHRGVVGIAAGRLARELNRPTILLGVDDEGATGSGRSIRGIHLHEFLSAWRDELPRFGGHAQAIGMSVPVDRLEGLRTAWEAAAERWQDQVSVRHHTYELDLAAEKVDEALLTTLSQLEPHGQGNPQPMIRVRGPLRLEQRRIFGNGHLSGRAMSAEGGMLRLLGWGWAERQDQLEAPFEALGYLEPDRYRGGVVLRLVDCRSVTATGEPLEPPAETSK